MHTRQRDIPQHVAATVGCPSTWRQPLVAPSRIQKHLSGGEYSNRTFSSSTSALNVYLSLLTTQADMLVHFLVYVLFFQSIMAFSGFQSRILLWRFSFFLWIHFNLCLRISVPNCLREYEILLTHSHSSSVHLYFLYIKFW